MFAAKLHTRFPRVIQAGYWSFPPLACLLVFHLGLFGWFVQDDFAGLQIAQKTSSAGDALQWLLRPMAQGVVRPLPDAFFWIGLYQWFGLNAFPYRLAVFLVQLANVVMMLGLSRRLTGSRAAGWIGALVWPLNTGMVTAMSWTSANSQILCCFFFLAGFLLFLKHLETGRWRWYAAQCLTFFLGLATLEITVVYPLLLLVYCAIAARRAIWKTAPLLTVAALYAAVSLWLIPRAPAGPYALHLDSSMLAGFWRYWSVAAGPARFAELTGVAPWTGVAFVILLTGGLVWALARASSSRRRVAVLGLAWFLLALAPVLPLRDQRMEYYLTIPTIGLGLAAAALLPGIPKWTAALWLLVYFGSTVPVLQTGMRYHYERSQAARTLLEGLREVRAHAPARIILLTGMGNDLFYAAMYDRGPSVMGLQNIYLAESGGIRARPGFLPLGLYEMPPGAAVAAVAREEAGVYAVSARGDVRDITQEYYADALTAGRTGPPAFVDVGRSYMAGALGEGWYEVSGGIRWMGRRAELRIAAPRNAGGRLRVRAVYPNRPETGTIRLAVAINGTPAGQAEIRDSASSEHYFAVPDSAVGAGEMTVRLETDRTFRVAPDVRDLGLAFGLFEVME